MTPRSVSRFTGLFLLWSAVACEAHETIIEFSPDLPPPTFLGGGTCRYGPTNMEKKFYNGLSDAARVTLQTRPGEFADASHAFTLQGHKGQYASWWGIVRGIKRDPHARGGTLLIENKYFDGFTDCNFQSISINGGGDFDINLTNIPGDLIPLILVRVYGGVTGIMNNRPSIKADYMRVWHWSQFRFVDSGEDHGNPEWKENAKLTPDENPYIIREGRSYYRDHLGPTAEQVEILRPFYEKRTMIQFANIPLESGSGRTDYAPTELEKQFFEQLSKDDQRTLQSKPDEPVQSDFQLRGHTGQFVSWFGIVREAMPAVTKCGGRLLIENKYFRDGQYDERPQTISINGAGNFKAELTSFSQDLLLSLVRVYGTVVREDTKMPVVHVSYMRVWRFGEFGFADYGEGHGDSRWRENGKRKPNEAAKLTADYYIRRLGPTTEQAGLINKFFDGITAMRELDLEHMPVEEIVGPAPTPVSSAK